jgi:hypothetical protein
VRTLKFIITAALALGAAIAPAQKTTSTIVDFVKSTSWKSNTGSSVNSIGSDAFVAFPDSVSGNLTVINQASKEMGGGLVSDQAPIPGDFNAKYFEAVYQFTISADDMPHLARHETDLKITLKSAPSGGTSANQANGSCQWNADKLLWQLDPTGKTWVDTGYKTPPIVGLNTLKIQFWSDGTKWSVTGISLNGEKPYVPDPGTFANIPMVTTNWGAGLHPQLQTEVRGAPWYFREQYLHVIVIASDSPIPWNLAA